MGNTLIWIPKRLVELSLINVAAHTPKMLISCCERDYDARVQHAAQKVIDANVRIVMLTGPSASGKTTTANKLAHHIKARGVCAAVISLDNFYRPLEEYPRLADGTPDYESLDALNIAEIHKCLSDIDRMGSAEIPEFDFTSAKRGGSKIMLEVGANGVVIVEGIHAHNPRLTALLPHEHVYKIYAGLREEYSENGQRILPTRDVRLARRMVRDYLFRGHSIEKTFGMWADVCAAEDKSIKVNKSEADLLLDTSFSCEICLLGPHVQKFAQTVPPASPYYQEIENLCARFARCMPLKDSMLPKDSMLREFLG